MDLRNYRNRRDCENFIKDWFSDELMISLSGCGNTNKGYTTTIIDTPTENVTSVLRFAAEDVNMREGIGTDSSILKVIYRGESVEFMEQKTVGVK